MKNKAKAIGPLIGLAVMLAIPRLAGAMPSDAQDPANRASVATGRKVAEAHCARCHAVTRTGRSPNRAAPPFRTIMAREKGAPLPGRLFIDGTVVRHPGMPQFELTAWEVDGLIAWIKALPRK